YAPRLEVQRDFDQRIVASQCNLAQFLNPRERATFARRLFGSATPQPEEIALFRAEEVSERMAHAAVSARRGQVQLVVGEHGTRVEKAQVCPHIMLVQVCQVFAHRGFSPCWLKAIWTPFECVCGM